MYDPADPVPTVGGRSLHININDPGIKNRESVQEREDLLVYSSTQLNESLPVAGPVSVNLFASTSAPDTDFTATLVDIEPDGYRVPVSEGILRARYRESMDETSFLEQGEVYEFEITLNPVAHTFNEGHQLCLEISSSNFPRFDRNPNRAMPVADSTLNDAQIAVQNVFHTTNYPTQISLPVKESE
jgi:putative CocE/NonD family hydrolase